MALADALRTNCTLQTLRLSLTHAWNDNAFFHALATALTYNGTLKSLIIGTCAVISDSIAHAFVDMLAQNHALEVLQLSRYKGVWKPHFCYYLKLNSQRRGYFHSQFGSLCKQIWIEEAVIPVRDDLEGIFYFLQMNPMLLYADC